MAKDLETEGCLCIAVEGASYYQIKAWLSGSHHCPRDLQLWTSSASRSNDFARLQKILLPFLPCLLNFSFNPLLVPPNYPGDHGCKSTYPHPRGKQIITNLSHSQVFMRRLGEEKVTFLKISVRIELRPPWGILLQSYVDALELDLSLSEVVRSWFQMWTKHPKWHDFHIRKCSI